MLDIAYLVFLIAIVWAVILMAAVLVVPSTLTLALPVVTAMVVTLADILSARGPQLSTPGRPPDGGRGSAGSGSGG